MRQPLRSDRISRTVEPPHDPRLAHRAYTGVRDATSVTLPRFAWSIGRVLRHVDGDPDFAVLVCREGAWAPVYLEVVRVRVGRRIDPDQTPDWGHANHNECPLGVAPTRWAIRSVPPLGTVSVSILVGARRRCRQRPPAPRRPPVQLTMSRTKRLHSRSRLEAAGRIEDAAHACGPEMTGPAPAGEDTTESAASSPRIAMLRWRTGLR
jgi:hypothetical protein